MIGNYKVPLILTLVVLINQPFAYEQNQDRSDPKAISTKLPFDLKSVVDESGNKATLSLPERDFIISISDSDGSSQLTPSVAYNSGDYQYLIVWPDNRFVERGGFDIYGQLLDGDGSRIGDDFPICTAPGDQLVPAVAYNSRTNQYLVVWSDDRAVGGTETDIYGQLVDNDGNLIGDNLPISTANDRQHTPTLAYNSTDNEYLVIWHDLRNRAVSGSDIYGQRVAPHGGLISGNFPVSTAPRDQAMISLAYDSVDNQYLVVWFDNRAAGAPPLSRTSEIYGQRIASDGRLMSGELRIAYNRWGVYSPSLAYNSQRNQYLVAYDSRGVAPDGMATVYAQILEPDGRLLSGTPITGAQGRPRVAYDSVDDQYLVVWEDYRGSAVSRDIYGQRIGSNGSPVMGNFPISTAPDEQVQAAIAHNSGDNQFLVVWEDWRNRASRRSDIYGQTIDAKGRLIETNSLISPDPDPVPGPDPFSQFRSSVAYNSADDQYLVVWDEERSPTGGNMDIYGQMVAADGRLISGKLPIATAPNNQMLPAVTYNSTDNEYLVVWYDTRNYASGGHGVYGQRVASDGRRIASNFPIAAHGTEFKPKIAYNSTNNQYLVVWSDKRAYAANGWDIYGQRVGSDGRLISNEFFISIAPYDQTSPSVVHNSTGNQYLVVWQDRRNYLSRNVVDIYGQQVDSDGRLIADNFSISTAPGGQSNPSVAYNSSDDQYLVVWWRTRTTPEGVDIYGQRLTGGGTPLAGDFPISMARGSNFVLTPTVAYNSTDNQYLVIWDKMSRVLGQKVGSDGRLISSNFRISMTQSQQGGPAVAYGNAANQHFVIWADRRNFITSGWDIYGQLLK